MAVLQAVTIVGVDEAIVKREEESRRPALSDSDGEQRARRERPVLWAKVGFSESSLWRSCGA